MTETPVAAFPIEEVALDELRPHPRNYRAHPADQLTHLCESIRAYGFYRNVVCARDGTILAGHGVALAARSMGYTSVPTIRLDLEPQDPRALKVLAADNEISHLGEVDDRVLAELLKEVKDFDPTGLLGTGYDEMMLANLVMVTRPAEEIATFDAAAAWVGMPEYEGTAETFKLVITFETEAERKEFCERIELRVRKTEGRTAMTRYPWRDRDDVGAVLFDG